MTPKGEKSELKKKGPTYKSQINLNVKGWLKQDIWLVV